jgi:hypothetical protein
MNAAMWTMLLWVFLAGAIGGVINALMTDNGFILPKRAIEGDQTTVLRPGYLGNVLIGAIGAVVSWGLYGPFGSVHIVGAKEALVESTGNLKLGLSLATFVGAILIGVAGARWLTNQVDKTMLQSAAAHAAGAKPSAAASVQIATASPAAALSIARNMPRSQQAGSD